MIAALTSGVSGVPAARRLPSAASLSRPKLAASRRVLCRSFQTYSDQAYDRSAWAAPEPSSNGAGQAWGQQASSWDTHQQGWDAHAEHDEQWDDAYYQNQHEEEADDHGNAYYGSHNHYEDNHSQYEDTHSHYNDNQSHYQSAHSQHSAAAPPAGVEQLGGNPLFTDQFMSVLRESLQRQGQGALTANTRPEEPRVSATVEVLEAALEQSKRTLAIMCQWRDQLDKQIAVQQKQVERVDFALNKSKSDAAYNAALKEMLHDS